jgi:hypothetical protein
VVVLRQVLPNGIAWISNLVKTIAEVAMNGCKSTYVDKKLIEGPNPNERGKNYIPLIFAFQVSFKYRILWSNPSFLLVKNMYIVIYHSRFRYFLSFGALPNALH